MSKPTVRRCNQRLTTGQYCGMETVGDSNKCPDHDNAWDRHGCLIMALAVVGVMVIIGACVAVVT